MSYRLVIFDFDGTLADTFPVFAENYPAIAERNGLKQFANDEVNALRSMSTQQILRSINLPLWKLPRVTLDFRNAMNNNAASIQPFAGIIESLTALREDGLRLALTSSNSEAVVRTVLGAQICKDFERIDCGASIFGKAKKISRIIKSLKIASSEAIYIGDETRDAKAAEEANIAFGAVAWGYTRIETLQTTHPQVCFSHPRDLQKLRQTS